MTQSTTLTPRSVASVPLDGIRPWVTDADLAKVVLPGTDRAHPVESSLAAALRCAKRVGVTRLAELTRLDVLGIPTYQAVRPAATTLTVSQGKGLTDALARVSALMESIELWHAEHVVVEQFVDTVRDLRPALTYDPYDDLPLEVNSLLHDSLPLEWVMARRLTDGRAVPVPYRLVNLDFTTPTGWRTWVFQETSNGLASGNTLVEAVLHGLYEVVERDALARAHRPGGRSLRFDPRAIGSDAVDELLDLFAAAEVTVNARWLPSPTGLPCVTVRTVSNEYQIVAGGHGCHLSMEIATTRALTEAAQSRLGLISGVRDDLSRVFYRPAYHMLPTRQDGAVRFAVLPPEVVGSTAGESLVDDLVELNTRCMAAFSSAPLVVDLSRPEFGLPVVRTIVPGCRLAESAA
jgi:ribosomal protein S12 methylthiotransferase accessory factor